MMASNEETFAFEDWLSDGLRGIRHSLKRKRRDPSAFRQHMRSSAREALLAVRSVIDHAVDSLEEEARPKKATKIKVE